VDRTFGSHSFALVGVLDPERDRLGQIIEYTYDLANVPLNAHGSGPFCNFQLPNAAAVAGVYAVTVRNELVYVGECQKVSSLMLYDLPSSIERNRKANLSSAAGSSRANLIA
jgi:hypothetical protein